MDPVSRNTEETLRVQEGLHIAKMLSKHFHRKNGYRVPLADIEGEAAEAVAKALTKYNPEKGSWGQWVYGYVRGYILRFIANNNPTGIRLPSFKMMKERPEFLHPVGVEPNHFLDGAPGESFLDRIPAKEDEPEGILSSEEIVLLLELACLSSKEREVTARRLMDPDCPTLDEIGKEWGVSRERVRQVEAAALGKLRKTATRMVNGDD